MIYFEKSVQYKWDNLWKTERPWAVVILWSRKGAVSKPFFLVSIRGWETNDWTKDGNYISDQKYSESKWNEAPDVIELNLVNFRRILILQ